MFWLGWLSQSAHAAVSVHRLSVVVLLWAVHSLLVCRYQSGPAFGDIGTESILVTSTSYITFLDGDVV